MVETRQSNYHEVIKNNWNDLRANTTKLEGHGSVPVSPYSSPIWMCMLKGLFLVFSYTVLILSRRNLWQVVFAEWT